MTVQTQVPTRNEVIAQLSQCQLSGCVDRTFGDGEWIWIDQNNMIIAEAYLSRSTGSFWTCPDGYWVITPNSRGELAWSYGENRDSSSQFTVDGVKEVEELLTHYKSKIIARNDKSD